MTRFRGLLLFDVAERAIGPWENQLGYRGMMEVWKKRGTALVVTIQPHESSEDDEEWEAWWGDENTGDSESIAFGTFEYCEDEAKEWMRKDARR